MATRRTAPNVRRGARSVIMFPRVPRAKANAYFDVQRGAFFQQRTRAHPRGLKLSPYQVITDPRTAQHIKVDQYGNLRVRGRVIPGWKFGTHPPESMRKGHIPPGRWLYHPDTRRVQFVPEERIQKGKETGTDPLAALKRAGYREAKVQDFAPQSAGTSVAA
jgi:hypothetical protein